MQHLHILVRKTKTEREKGDSNRVYMQEEMSYVLLRGEYVM